VTELREAVDRIRAWGEAREWRGYDPYDALNSPLARYLTLGTELGRRLLTQAVKLTPVNVRPVLRITPEWNAKAIGLVASAYARLWAARRDETARVQALRWLEWLVANSTAEIGLGWGYHFDVQTRVFGYTRGTPNAIATSFASHALLDGHELIDDDERWGAAAVRACRFLVETLLEDDGERLYVRYLPAERELVHNANVLACSVLARTAALLGRTELEQTVKDSLSSTLHAQEPDGSWPYSEEHKWVDNFHTGYVLESLGLCEGVDERIRPALERGFDYWEQALFLEDGTPKYTPSSLYPIDAHNYGQAIETWLSAVTWRIGARERAERCAHLLVERMLNPRGYVDFQQRRALRSRVPFVRWTTAPSFKALARLELVRAAP
jgi:hypothetical protein